MYKTILPLVVACTLLLLTSCKKQCVNHTRAFQAYGTIAPNKNLFNVGDTIKIRLWVDKCGLELGSNTQMCMENTLELEMLLGLLQVSKGAVLTDSGVRNSIGAHPFFKVSPRKGSFYGLIPNPHTRDRAGYFRTEATNSQFLLELDVVCLQPGIYRIMIGDFYLRYYPGMCGTLTAPIDIQYPVIENNLITPLPWSQPVRAFIEGGYSIRVT
jgi:hypothetical protein